MAVARRLYKFKYRFGLTSLAGGDRQVPGIYLVYYPWYTANIGHIFFSYCWLLGLPDPRAQFYIRCVLLF